MKLSLILTFFAVFTVSANVNVMSQQVTLDFKDAELSKVFRSLREQTGRVIIYDYDLIRTDKSRVSIRLENVALAEALDELLKDLPYSYTVNEDRVLIIPSPDKTQQAPVYTVVTGRVTDTRGNPLAGVTVIAAGTTAGTATDANGNFTLRVPKPDDIVLQFSFIGKKDVRVPYAGRPIALSMEDAVSEIEQVIVTGIFTKARESYTGAVTTISSEELQNFRGQNLIQTLRNIDPSINILADNISGSDPNKLPEITIRGQSSLPVNVKEFNEGQKSNLNTPLIIMDGFEITLQKLMDYNDEEIESINIMKDASATAIYGSRGANGVIVIISKQPQAGKLRVNAKVGFDAEIPDLSSYDLMNAREKLQMEKDNGFYENATLNTYLVLQEIYNSRYRDVVEGTDTYWLGKPLRTGLTQRYNLNLTGGSQEFRWGVTTAYQNIEGAMKGSSRDNFTGGITLSYQHKDLIFRNQSDITLNKAVNSRYGSFGDYAAMNPYWKVYDEEGVLIPYYEAVTGSSGGGREQVSNPLYNASLNSINESGYTNFINNFSIEWKILEGLILRGQLGVSKTFNKSDVFTPPGHTDFKNYVYGEDIFRRGRYVYSDSEASSYDGSITMSYVKTFHEKHQLYVGASYSVSQQKSEQYEFVGEGYINEQVNSLGAALKYAENTRPKETESLSRRVGFTANINYTYDNRYFADFSVRMDGSSQFGSNKRFAPFWSAGLGWNVHRERFLADSDWVSQLRFKLSFGQTGSQQFSTYQALRTYYYTTERYGPYGGAFLKGFGNKDLKWQVTDQFNAGMEFSTLNNRLTAAFDYYVKKTSNLLSELDIPSATGFASYTANVGEIKNTGFEVALGGFLIRTRDLVLTLNGRLAYNKNEITKLSDAIVAQNEKYLEQDVDVSTLFYKGYSQNALYVMRSQGIDPSNGKEVFIDRFGNITDTWNPRDKVYVGVSVPPYRGNLSTMLRYREFTLNLSCGYHWGGVTYNQTLIERVEMPRSQIGKRNVDRRVLTERWQKPGDRVRFRKIAAMGETEVATRATSRFVMNDRAFELQTASLQYRWDTEWLKKTGISSVTFAVNSSDLFYFSSVKRERGTGYPFARRIGFNLTLVY